MALGTPASPRTGRSGEGLRRAKVLHEVGDRPCRDLDGDREPQKSRRCEDRGKGPAVSRQDGAFASRRASRVSGWSAPCDDSRFWSAAAKAAWDSPFLPRPWSARPSASWQRPSLFEDNAGADEVLVQAQGSRRVRPRLFPFARLEFELRAPQQGQRQVDGVLAARICEGHRAVGGGSGGSVVAARLAEQRLLGGERGERHVTGRQHSLESRLQLLEEGRGSREMPHVPIGAFPHRERLVDHDLVAPPGPSVYARSASRAASGKRSRSFSDRARLLRSIGATPLPAASWLLIRTAGDMILRVERSSQGVVHEGPVVEERSGLLGFSPAERGQLRVGLAKGLARLAVLAGHAIGLGDVHRDRESARAEEVRTNGACAVPRGCARAPSGRLPLRGPRSSRGTGRSIG